MLEGERKMKVVLVADVKGLGRAGDVKEVAEGYARNYLLPRGLAAPATESRLKGLLARREVAARRQARAEERRRLLAARIGQLELRFTAKAGGHQRLFGSITAADIAAELSRRVGETVDKRLVELSEPIKQLGTYQVAVRLGKGLAPQMTVVVEGE